MEKSYILPPSAADKFKEAQKRNQHVYIFGMCGYGKTSFVLNMLKNTNYSYYDMFTDPLESFDVNICKKTTIVIDNLGFLHNNSIIGQILDLIQNPLCRCIFISRARCPEWLITPLNNTGGFISINESDLSLSFKEALGLFTIHGISSSSEDALHNLYNLSQGHPLFLSYIAARINPAKLAEADNSNYCNMVFEEARQLLNDYLDHELLEKWSDKIIDFAVKMSIVPSFTLPLAVELTGVNNIEKIIDEANRIGSFLSVYDGVYSICKPLRHYMSVRMYSIFSKDKIMDIYNNAGHYFMRHKKILESYEMYEKSGNKSAQLDLLIENARLNPSDGYLTELKSAYFALDEETIRKHPELTAAMCLLNSIMLDIDASEYWYSILEKDIKTYKGRTQKTAKLFLTYLDIACIHKPSANVLQILKNFATKSFDKSIIIPEWALTCNGPTIMNGGRDFCEWSKTDAELYSMLEAPFRKIFGKSSAGMPDLSLAESYFEKGASDYEIMRLAAKGQMDADMRGRVELSFVAVGILSQLHLIHGHIDDAVSTIIKFRNSHLDTNPKLIQNVDALLCRISLLTNDTAAIDRWLEAAPDENIDFNVLYRYLYLCKIRCYLAKNNLSAAFTLLNKMMYYAETCDRVFIKIECLLLMSIFEYRSNLPAWDATLSSALKMAEEYHFIRIVSRESAALCDMLNKCTYNYSNPEYKKQLFDEVKSLSQLYPSYLCVSSYADAKISDNALEILKLQAQDLSNDEIANKLFISKNTVKYHCKENYKKLGVNSRLAAISEAKKRGIL